MGLLSRLKADARSIAGTEPDARMTPTSILAMLKYDGYCALALTRIREAAVRHRIPGVNWVLRMAQLTFYNIEISKEATLGDGVNFVHTLGVVIGGNSQIGERTAFLGNATIGNLNNRGFPKVGRDVIIGAGARVLGPITIGDGAQVGANAVVMTDVPAGATAVGVPAVVKIRETRTGPRASDGGAADPSRGRPVARPDRA